MSITAIGIDFFSRLFTYVVVGLSKIDERVVKVFAFAYGFLRQSLYFAWGINDLRLAHLAEKQSRTRLDSLIAGCMLLVSGAIGIVGEVVTIAMAPSVPSWKVVLISSGSLLFFFASCIYLKRNIEQWQLAENARAKVGSILGIISSIGYLTVAFFGIFGIQTLALSILCFGCTLLGLAQLIVTSK